MNKLRCIVVDDEPLARKVITGYLEELHDTELLAELKSAIELKRFLEKENAEVDLIFLDINMPKLSGMDFARNFNSGTAIIFTTAHPEFAVEAFDINASDYLLKPISFDRFLKSIDKIKNDRKSNTKDWIIIKENKRLYKLNLEDIYYLQAYGDYVKLITKEKNYITKARLADYADTLSDQFQQCHRSYIINMPHVQYMEGNQLFLNGEKIPVSTSYRDKFLRQFS